MNKEQLLKTLEKLLKPVLKESEEVNYGFKQDKNAKVKRVGIEFLYNGLYVRVEIK